MSLRRAIYLSISFGLLNHLPLFASGEWPQFRGPDGQGRADAHNLPLTWSEESNVKWKTAIHGKAWSSPVLWDNQIWLTTATPDGRELSVICVDRDSGKIIRDLKLFELENPPFCHDFNSYASPTPVIEAGRLYVSFGSMGTACLDTKGGQVLWERRDLLCNHFRGPGSSPIIHGDLMFMNFDGSDRQYVIALEKKTGRTFWQTNRSVDFKDLDPDGKPKGDGDYRKAFGTPQIVVEGGEPMLISPGSRAIYAYNPINGQEIWRVEERNNYSSCCRPVFGKGLIFCSSGWANGQLMAIRPGKKGGVIDANKPVIQSPEGGPQVVWQMKRNAPRKPSPVLVNDLLFMVDDSGIATCLEATSGRELWRERIGGNYSASPISAEGRIYFFSEEGKTTVVAATGEFKKLAENKLNSGFMASPAVAGQAFFLRSRTHLYRIENSTAPAHP